MANIDTLEEWHLTPQGWIKNDLKSKSSDRDKPTGVPQDRLLTVQDWEYERSSWSELNGGCSYTFISEDRPQLSAAIDKYGKAPDPYLAQLSDKDPLKMDNIPFSKFEKGTGKILQRHHNGECLNCGGSGTTGKDRTGDDFTCPRCDGSGKVYIWK